MKIAPDTNLLVRALTGDDEAQAAAARRCLSEATRIFLSSPVLCETAWVLKRFYGAPRETISAGIRALIEADTAEYDFHAVTAGLSLLDAGGDFADGVIAATGIGMGAEVFVTFDGSARKRLADAGIAVQAPDQMLVR